MADSNSQRPKGNEDLEYVNAVEEMDELNQHQAEELEQVPKNVDNPANDAQLSNSEQPEDIERMTFQSQQARIEVNNCIDKHNQAAEDIGHRHKLRKNPNFHNCDFHQNLINQLNEIKEQEMQSQIPDLPQLPESPLSFRSDEITKAHLEYLMEMVEVHGSTGQRPKQFTINVNDQSQIKNSNQNIELRTFGVQQNLGTEINEIKEQKMESQTPDNVAVGEIVENVHQVDIQKPPAPTS